MKLILTDQGQLPKLPFLLALAILLGLCLGAVAS